MDLRNRRIIMLIIISKALKEIIPLREIIKYAIEPLKVSASEKE